jgi:hypothetical protein
MADPVSTRAARVDESVAVVKPSQGYFEIACGKGAPPFVILLRNPDQLGLARAILQKEEKDRVLIQGTVVTAPARYNTAWGFHLDPDSIRFVAKSDPVGEESASAVDRHLERAGSPEFLPNYLWSPTAGMARLERALAPEEVDAVLEPGEVLAEELEYVRRYRASLGRAGVAPPGERRVSPGQQALFDSGAAALCLSGGGIRSATFNLGVLQGLAKKGVLDRFDYVSTVSGGGYIGGWLAAWAFRSGHLANVLPILRKDSAGVLHTDPQSRSPIEWLRDFSNYLSPKVGIFSVDTWTLFATYIRNLLVIWLAIIPPLMALLALPRAVIHLMNTIPGGVDWGPLAQAGLIAGAGALLLMYGEHYSYTLTTGSARTRGENYFSKVNLSFMAGVILISWAWIVAPKDSSTVLMVPAIAAATLVIAAFQGCLLGEAGQMPASARDKVVLAAILALVVTAFNVLVLFELTADLTVSRTEAPSWQYVLFPVMLLYMLLLGDLVYVAFTSHITTDEDRERWAKSGAWFAILAIGWVAYTGIAIVAPLALWREGSAPDWIAHAVNGAGASVLGIVLALVGRSPDSKAVANGRPSAWRRFGLPVAMLLFVVLVLSLLASLCYGLEQFFGEDRRTGGQVPVPGVIGGAVGTVPVLAAWVVLGFLLVVCWLVLKWVNINHFSLHAMYRDRLIRAYLGAARSRHEMADQRFTSEPAQFDRFPHTAGYRQRWRSQQDPRSANPYTGFDEADNLDLWWLGIHGTQPLWIINMALNISPGRKHLSWQERKAATFTTTPLHCGSWLTNYRRAWAYGGTQGGISCGTAMAVSGAAANPNMGYHSSAALTFLMTFFNVRLGWWLGNPNLQPDKRSRQLHRERGPSQGLLQLIRELVGKVDENSNWIHLSDGGHFENLGLYEVVLRRCKYIVVADASADPDRGFEDLGNAIRKIRTDLNVNIEPRHGQEWRIGQRDQAIAAGHACFDVKYGDDPADWGCLLYIKPSVYDRDPRLPADVRQYARVSDSFPHEPTTDQFFTESQFESYRALGEYQVMHQILRDLDPAQVEKKGMPAVFDTATSSASLGVT